ncbi:hypothetical protein ABER98_17070 [Domibacillus aminovorans]|uniref:hypothetical protein n=1 Tax=Domibacillus aminovorans TaxID=29332 RepID=UPI003D20B831
MKKSFLKKVPGFRSDKRKNKIISGVIYFYLFAVIFVGIGKLTGVEVPTFSSENGADIQQQSASKPKSAEKEKTKIPEYSIVKDDLAELGRWRLTLETNSTNETELKNLVAHTRKMAKEKDEKVASIFVDILKKDSPSKFPIASGRLVLDNIGQAQTGSDTETIDFTYQYDAKEHESFSICANPPRASKVLVAFKSAGLSVPEPRDNTINCMKFKCVQLITTEVVSIYKWPDEVTAKKILAKGIGDHQAGSFTIRFSESYNADGSIKYQPFPSKKAYIEQLDKLIYSKK